MARRGAVAVVTLLLCSVAFVILRCPVCRYSEWRVSSTLVDVGIATPTASIESDLWTGQSTMCSGENRRSGRSGVNGTEARQQSALCISRAPYLCENRGTEFCNWPVTPEMASCRFQNFTNEDSVPFSNRIVVFHGDSTLREVVDQIFIRQFQTVGAKKSDANMSSRAILGARSLKNGTNNLAVYRFDYTFDQLDEGPPIHHVWPTDAAAATTLPDSSSTTADNTANALRRCAAPFSSSSTSSDPSLTRRPPDAVVVGLGLYLARNIMTNSTMKVNLTTGHTSFEEGSPTNSMEYISATAAKRIVSLVCDKYQAPFGLFVGSRMECGPLKNLHRAAKRKLSHPQCVREEKVLRKINTIVEQQLKEFPPREDGCAVHYVTPIKCQNQNERTKYPCLHDGVHSRPLGKYARSKSQIVLNALSGGFGAE